MTTAAPMRRQKHSRHYRVMPLTVLGGERRGLRRRTGRAVPRGVATDAYPRRDAIVVLQADFTDQPENLPEMIKRFDGGADIVARRTSRRRPNVPPPCARSGASRHHASLGVVAENRAIHWRRYTLSRLRHPRSDQGAR